MNTPGRAGMASRACCGKCNLAELSAICWEGPVPVFILELGSKTKVYRSPFLTHSSAAELVMGQIFSLEYLWGGRTGSDVTDILEEGG